jgi:hypothetical protein
MIGINDLLQGETVDKVANNYQLILQELKEKNLQSQVFVKSILPLNQNFADPAINKKVVELNARIKKYLKNFNFNISICSLIFWVKTSN